VDSLAREKYNHAVKLRKRVGDVGDNFYVAVDSEPGVVKVEGETRCERSSTLENTTTVSGISW
jgi:hypothetical protein